MITAIYDLRDYGFRHVKTSSDCVQYFKIVNGEKWDLIEDDYGYLLTKNGRMKEQTFDFQYIVAVIRKHKLL